MRIKPTAIHFTPAYNNLHGWVKRFDHTKSSSVHWSICTLDNIDFLSRLIRWELDDSSLLLDIRTILSAIPRGRGHGLWSCAWGKINNLPPDTATQIFTTVHTHLDNVINAVLALHSNIDPSTTSTLRP